MMPEMLLSKKVKVHSMRSRRWDISDKITQYKGIVNLYARDKKIFEADTGKDIKKLRKQITQVRKEVDDQRFELYNAIAGDRQRLRNTLAANRSLLLAYSRLHPTKVVEILFQENFNKRKYLDRINYAMKQKTQKLIDLKLEYAILEDRLESETNDSKNQIKEEEQAQIITAKLQDAMLKNETAKDVQYTYKAILNLLQKDAVFFDAVLNALRIDGFNQGKCILKVTEMGQLATEYLDNKRDEYNMLEAALKVSMQEREKSIEKIKNNIQALSNNVRYLIRRDSVVAILDEERETKDTPSDVELISSIHDISFTLNKIRSITIVSRIEDIYPRFLEQERQRQRLQELLTQKSKARNILLLKSKHAEEMFNNLNHTMIESTMWYKEEKIRINDEISALNERMGLSADIVKEKGELYVKIREALQQLVEILRVVKVKVEPLKTKKDVKKVEPVAKKGKKSEAAAIVAAAAAAEEEETATIATVAEGDTKKKKKVRIVPGEKPTPPEICEPNVKKLLNIINKKLQVVIKETDKHPPEEKAEPVFENFVTGMITIADVIKSEVKDESLIDDMMFDDPSVPNRVEIKAKSAEICLKNVKPEWEI